MAPLCNLCRQVPQDDIDEMKLLDNCDLLGGDLCPDCQDHLALEAKISAAKQVLNDLLVERPKIRTRINQRHDKLTTRVPLEIVRSIFQFCAAAKSNTSPFEEWTLRDPLRLGSICKTWRDIAWANQPLWTTFVLDLGDRIQKPNSLVLTREWLERAGQLPLSILISAGPHSGMNGPLTVEEIKNQYISIINELSTQWRYLHISDGLELSQLKGCSGGAPNLQIIRIETGHHAFEFSLTNGLPRPSDLRLGHFPLRNVHIDWTALTRVDILQPSSQESIELIRRAVNLVHCRFTAITGDQPSSNSTPIHHQNLEHLDLQCPALRRHDQSRQIITLFKAFVFHKLKHLTIQTGSWDWYEHTDQGGPSPVAPGLPYVINSTSLLLSMDIQYLGPHEIDSFMLPLLHSTPSLRQLHIKSWREGWGREPNPFLQALASSSGSKDKDSDFLPNLESLELHLHKHDALRLWKHIPGIVGAVSDIHNPRRRPLNTLRVRTLDTGYIHPPNLVLQLLRLREEGIVLDLKDGNKDILEESMRILALTPSFREASLTQI